MGERWESVGLGRKPEGTRLPGNDCCRVTVTVLRRGTPKPNTDAGPNIGAWALPAPSAGDGAGSGGGGGRQPPVCRESHGREQRPTARPNKTLTTDVPQLGSLGFLPSKGLREVKERVRVSGRF